MPKEIFMGHGWISQATIAENSATGAIVLGDEWGIPEEVVRPISLRPLKTVDELLVEGDFDATDLDITEEHFPSAHLVNRDGTDISLFQFPPNVHTDDILRGLVKHHFRPAYAHEVLRMATRWPGLQFEHSIVALGNSWRQGKMEQVVAICRRRNTHLSHLDYVHLRAAKLSSKFRVWPGYYRVAAVKLP